jgi:hypothetical protein
VGVWVCACVRACEKVMLILKTEKGEREVRERDFKHTQALVHEFLHAYTRTRTRIRTRTRKQQRDILSHTESLPLSTLYMLSLYSLCLSVCLLLSPRTLSILTFSSLSLTHTHTSLSLSSTLSLPPSLPSLSLSLSLVLSLSLSPREREREKERVRAYARRTRVQ